jgi:hypothetical protein
MGMSARASVEPITKAAIKIARDKKASMWIPSLAVAMAVDGVYCARFGSGFTVPKIRAMASAGRKLA